MPKPTKKTPAATQPIRVPPARAQGLEPELTAQPKPLSDERTVEGRIEAGLSVDPEDLGAHLLSEAIEQAEAPGLVATDVELPLIGAPPTDEVLTRPNFEYENTLWEQTVDLTLQTAGAASQLRAPAEPGDEPEERRPLESSIRELSLFDREDDTSPIELPTESEPPVAHTQGVQTEPRAQGVQAEPAVQRERQQSATPASAAASGNRLQDLWRRPARRLALYLAGVLRRLAGSNGARAPR